MACPLRGRQRNIVRDGGGGLAVGPVTCRSKNESAWLGHTARATYQQIGRGGRPGHLADAAWRRPRGDRVRRSAVSYWHQLSVRHGPCPLFWGE